MDIDVRIAYVVESVIIAVFFQYVDTAKMLDYRAQYRCLVPFLQHRGFQCPTSIYLDNTDPILYTVYSISKFITILVQSKALALIHPPPLTLYPSPNLLVNTTPRE
jgi:hypothetical protein